MVAPRRSVDESWQDLDDEALLVAVRAGHDEAWEELVRRSYPRLLRFLTIETGNPDDAADLAQETLLDAYRDLTGREVKGPLRPWLFAIARNNLRPFWRRRSLRRFISLEGLSERAREALGFPHRSEDPAAVVAERDDIERTLADLAPRRRQALLLYGVEGLSTQEVAVLLGITPSNAERLIGRAKEQFRERFDARTESARQTSPSAAD